MAGPTCGVLLPGPRSEDHRDALDILVRMLGHGCEWDFSVATTKPIGGSYLGEPRPFVTEFHSYYPEHEPLDGEFVEAAFGYVPGVVLGIGAMCNGAIDHRILAEIAAWLAEELGGVIDLNGEIPLSCDHPGRHVEIPYENVVGSVSTYHVFDAMALRAWLEKSQFHMIK